MDFPSVPENFYKILVALGLFIGGVAIYEYNKDLRTLQSTVRQHFLDIKEHEIKRHRLLYNKTKAEKKADKFIKSSYPSLSLDRNHDFLRHYFRDKLPKTSFDSLDALITTYEDAEIDLTLAFETISAKKKILDADRADFSTKTKIELILFVLGIGFFLVGSYGLIRDQNLERLSKHLELLQKPRIHENCQSCGKNFSSIILRGTDTDGSKNFGFCLECYSAGTFNDTDLAALELRLNTELNGIPSFSQKRKNQIIKNLSSLERWKDDKF